MVLELVHIGIHTVGRGRSHGAAGIALWSLGRSGIEDGMILEVGRHLFASIQTSLQLGVRDVAGHDDRTLQVDTCRNGILRQFSTNGINALVQVDDNLVLAFASLCILGRNQFSRIGIHLLEPDTVGVDLRFDIAVGRTTHAHTDGARCAMARQTDDANVVGQILAAELCAQTNLMGLFEQFVLKVDVAESTSCLVASRGQSVVILDGGQLHREQVLLG